MILPGQHSKIAKLLHTHILQIPRVYMALAGFGVSFTCRCSRTFQINFQCFRRYKANRESERTGTTKNEYSRRHYTLYISLRVRRNYNGSNLGKLVQVNNFCSTVWFRKRHERCTKSCKYVASKRNFPIFFTDDFDLLMYQQKKTHQHPSSSTICCISCAQLPSQSVHSDTVVKSHVLFRGGAKNRSSLAHSPDKSVHTLGVSWQQVRATSTVSRPRSKYRAATSVSKACPKNESHEESVSNATPWAIVVER